MTYVNVYVWQTASFEKLGLGTYQWSKYSPGHVALETYVEGRKIEYISYWPGKHAEACKCEIATSHLHTLAEDIKAEKNTQPEPYKLYLNVQAINELILKFKRRIAEGFLDWGVFGSSVFKQPYEQNCASLVLLLLKHGGLHEPLEQQKSSRYSRMIATASACTAIFAALGVPSLKGIFSIYKLYNEYQQTHWKYGCEIVALTINRVWANHSAMLATTNLMQQISLCADKDGLANEQLMKATNFVSTIETIRDEIISLINEELIEKLNRTSVRFMFVVSTLSLLTPIALSFFLIYLSRELMLKTVTPKDVEELVKKAKGLSVKPLAISHNFKKVDKSTVNHLSDKSFVRVWVWKKICDDQAPEYGHIALQIFSTDKKVVNSKYISFRDKHPGIITSFVSCSEMNGHWHKEKIIDDELEKDKDIVFYDLDLNIENMTRELEKMQKKKNLSSFRLISNLLEQGGIVKYTKQKISFLHLFKGIALAASVFSGVNFAFYRGLLQIDMPIFEFYKKFDEKQNTLLNLERAIELSYKMISQLAARVLVYTRIINDKSGFQELLNRKTINDIAVSEAYSKLRTWNPELYKITNWEFSEHISSVKTTFLNVSKWAVAPVITGAIVYSIYRLFFSKKTQACDIERIVKNACKQQKRELMINDEISASTLWDKLTWKKTFFIGTVLLGVVGISYTLLKKENYPTLSAETVKEGRIDLDLS